MEIQPTSSLSTSVSDSTIRSFIQTMLRSDQLNEPGIASDYVPPSLSFNTIRDAICVELLGGRKLDLNHRKTLTEELRYFRERRAKILRRFDDDAQRSFRREFIVCTAYTTNYTIGKLCSPVNMEYCHRHGYHWIEESDHEYESMLRIISPRTNCSWYKILMLKRLMNRLLAEERIEQLPTVAARNVRYLMWIDADAIIVNPERTLESIVETSGEMELIISEDMSESSRINAGIFLLKVCPWSASLLEDVWQSERYFKVAHFDQAAMEKQLRVLFEGLDEKYLPFHSYSPSGPRGPKFFTHTCVLESQDFNTNISDRIDEILADGEGRDVISEGGKLSKRQRKLRRKSAKDSETRGKIQRFYAQFAFHVAGRRNKVKVLLDIFHSRGIAIPSELGTEELQRFSGRPFYKPHRTPCSGSDSNSYYTEIESSFDAPCTLSTNTTPSSCANKGQEHQNSTNSS